MKQLEDLMIAEGDTLRVQPCVSPVWDTALSLIALADAGITPQAEAVQCGRRLAARPRDPPARRLEPLEPRRRAGRLVLRVPQRLLSRHRRHGDGADGAGAKLAVSPRGSSASDDRRRARRSRMRGLHWLLAMQNSDGGWAAFDRDINREVLEKVPFADHNAMLDPSCPDITARVLEALGHFGYRVGSSRGAFGPSSSSAGRRSPTAAGRAAGASTTSTAPGRCSRVWARSASMRRPDGAPGGRLAQARPATERRLGRKLRAATTTRRWPASASRPRRKRPGRCSA